MKTQGHRIRWLFTSLYAMSVEDFLPHITPPHEYSEYMNTICTVIELVVFLWRSHTQRSNLLILRPLFLCFSICAAEHGWHSGEQRKPSVIADVLLFVLHFQLLCSGSVSRVKLITGVMLRFGSSCFPISFCPLQCKNCYLFFLMVFFFLSFLY